MKYSRHPASRICSEIWRDLRGGSEGEGADFSFSGLILARTDPLRWKPAPHFPLAHFVIVLNANADVVQAACGHSRSGEPLYDSDVRSAEPSSTRQVPGTRGLSNVVVAFSTLSNSITTRSHVLSRFVGLRGETSAKEASPAIPWIAGPASFRVFDNGVGVRDRSVETNPISFGHLGLLVEIVHRVAADSAREVRRINSQRRSTCFFKRGSLPCLLLPPQEGRSRV